MRIIGQITDKVWQRNTHNSPLLWNSEIERGRESGLKELISSVAQEWGFRP